MIRFDHVTFAYADAAEPTLRDVNLTVDAGELCLVIGPTGAGKSTLLGLVNGLVPHFTGGHVSGAISVDGRDTRDHKPRDMADLVGVVGQDPLAGFVTDTVEEELAYAMEQLAIEPSVMRKRVEETLDLLGIADLRNRPMRTLSGGQQQRVAIGSVLTAHPRVLVLDEPTSALDPTAAEDVLAAITRLVHDLGVTVVVAEHRMERVVQYADRVIELPGDGTARIGAPASVLATSTIAPPIVHLGRLAGWDPLPLSVRDARRVADPLRQRLSVHAQRHGMSPPMHSSVTGAAVALAADGVVVTYGDTVAVREVGVELRAGRVVALMGRNGSGKSSLLWALQGSGPRAAGRVRVGDRDPHELPAAQARALVGLVPQTPADLLYLETVAAECAQADHESDAVTGTCRKLLDRLVPDVAAEQHPRDLSEGQRLALVLAIQLTASPQVVLLDEPTRGLDYLAKDRLREILRELANEGHAIVVATHDVEFVAAAADEVIVMAQGEVVAAGATAEVVSSSPAFAPQVSKVLSPAMYLTVADVAAALEDE
ncbi:MAG: energy-coupling factor transport system ATP-binding protein [Actinomycetota bacterium]|jgi:energy-coupling factor transport system ATP-binding protein